MQNPEGLGFLRSNRLIPPNRFTIVSLGTGSGEALSSGLSVLAYPRSLDLVHGPGERCRLTVALSRYQRHLRYRHC